MLGTYSYSSSHTSLQDNYTGPYRLVFNRYSPHYSKKESSKDIKEKVFCRQNATDPSTAPRKTAETKRNTNSVMLNYPKQRRYQLNHWQNVVNQLLCFHIFRGYGEKSRRNIRMRHEIKVARILKITSKHVEHGVSHLPKTRYWMVNPFSDSIKNLPNLFQYFGKLFAYQGRMGPKVKEGHRASLPCRASEKLISWLFLPACRQNYNFFFFV